MMVTLIAVVCVFGSVCVVQELETYEGADPEGQCLKDLGELRDNERYARLDEPPSIDGSLICVLPDFSTLKVAADRIDAVRKEMGSR